jgi:hypothetical protein
MVNKVLNYAVVWVELFLSHTREECFCFESKPAVMSLPMRPKKNTCGSGSRPTLFFSADPIIFSTRLTVRPYFLRVVAGCCQNGVCCHTNSLKKPWKEYLKKIISDLPWLYEDRRRWKTDDYEGGNDDHDGQLLESEYWWRFRRRHFEEQWCFDKEQITQSESGNLFVLFRFSS